MAWNFSSGPARLPDEVLARAREELFHRGPDGASALERPFTGAAFQAVLTRAQASLRELLDLPPQYRILFLAGGAMHQFSLVPMNLVPPGGRAAYAHSGYWSRRALEAARALVPVTVAARHPGLVPLASPALESWDLPADCAYCHITPNETVDGIAYPSLPDTGAIPLAADCTSYFLTAPLDMGRFGLVYASAQKNIGPAGLTVAILREDVLERCNPRVPGPFSYRAQAEARSCLNTPPTLAIHLAAMVFDWIAANGGLAALAAANRAKADALYAAIDGSGGFYRAPVEKGHRSASNVRFHLESVALTDTFLAEAESAGLTNLRGHRQVGGLRASLYNAMPMAGVAALTDFMADFRRRHG